MANEFSPRLIAPSVVDKNWINVNYGGNNRCIVIDEDNGSTLPNCVGYAWGRFLEINGSCNLSTNNADKWYKHEDNYSRGTVPALGAVVCWAVDNGYGHVAIVESINSDGSIVTSESAYDGSRFWTQTRKPPNYSDNSRYHFQGFIYSPTYRPDMQNSSADSIIAIAESHLNEDGSWVWNQFGYGSTWAWCAGFVTCCAKAANLSDIIPLDTSCSSLAKKMETMKTGTFYKGPAQNNSFTPVRGDLIFFRWNETYRPNKYDADHIGIVTEVKGTAVHTIEGNSSNKVARRSYSIQSDVISAYVRPKYPVLNVIHNMDMLYTSVNTEEDALIREIGFLDTLSLQPSISTSAVKLSVINYTSVVGSLLNNTAYQINNISTDRLSYTVRQIAECLKSKEYNGSKLNAAAIAAILGNCERESQFDPSIDVLDVGMYSAGLFQWRASRRTAMQNWCIASGGDWKNNISGQIDYLWHELCTGYKYSCLLGCERQSIESGIQGVALLDTPDTETGVRAAVANFVCNFEIPANTATEIELRINGDKYHKGAMYFFKQLITYSVLN